VSTIAQPSERIEAALLATSERSALRVVGVRMIAVGWATVELDRAALELATGLDLTPEAFEPAPRSAVLGCACRVAAGILAHGVSIVLLEPDTEGRLAAWLARVGEGPAAVWLEADSPAAAVDELRAARIDTSAERRGPFGPESLILDGTVGGLPCLLLGSPAGTIRP
jgi:hypothetical protein